MKNIFLQKVSLILLLGIFCQALLTNRLIYPKNVNLSLVIILNVHRQHGRG